MSVKNEVIQELETKLAITNITEDSLLKDLGIDSLDVVEYVFELEDKYSIEFPTEELQNLKTIGDLVQIIDQKLAK